MYVIIFLSSLRSIFCLFMFSHNHHETFSTTSGFLFWVYYRWNRIIICNNSTTIYTFHIFFFILLLFIHNQNILEILKDSKTISFLNSSKISTAFHLFIIILCLSSPSSLSLSLSLWEYIEHSYGFIL